MPEDDVQERLASVEARLSALEAAAATPTPAPLRDVDPSQLWVVDVLQTRRGPPFESATSRGSLVYAGSLRAPGTGPVVWQVERSVPALLDQAWDLVAPTLAALGHPIRLEIVRRLLDGARTSQELQESTDLGTSGRLYHHLRELQACGLIVSPRRNTYAVPSQKVVACLIVVAAAAELALVAPPGSQSEEAFDVEDD
jgi:DNA-binding transcriptional ArsR family regulator